MVSNPLDADYIVINSGINESAQTPPVGDFDSIITMSTNDIATSTDNEKNQYSVLGAMRWCILKLKESYPNAIIVGVLPWQCGNATYCQTYRNVYKEPMTRMYQYFGLPVIDAFNEGNFYAEDLVSPKFKYTIDYIHVKVGDRINEIGRDMQRRFIVKEFVNKAY